MDSLTGLVVESVEGLAEALHRLLCPTRNLPQRFCSATCGGIAEHLIDSGAVRPAAEVRAEGAAEVRARVGAVIDGHTDLFPIVAKIRQELRVALGAGRAET